MWKEREKEVKGLISKDGILYKWFERFDKKLIFVLITSAAQYDIYSIFSNHNGLLNFLFVRI